MKTSGLRDVFSWEGTEEAFSGFYEYLPIDFSQNPR